MSENNKALQIFNELTVSWFEKTLGAPTAVQNEAWPAIAAGKDTLVSAPTGTGKTLSAFLVFIDRLKKSALDGTLEKKLNLIYISPLKSLAGDIRENLRRPLDGIYDEQRARNEAGASPFDISISVRTGDTSASERRAMIKSPPHILITTPESLYLMLTSESGKKILKTASAVIIDELHAIIGSKRGAHLMLSLARLDRLCEAPLQRIGLSATIEPLETAAEYLSPGGAIIAAPKMEKLTDIRVTSPLTDSRILPQGSIWPDIARSVVDCCEKARSVIAFVEGRMHAEKLAHYVNIIAGDGFARTHHGSVSKQRRTEVEEDLREGRLRLLCATSSMELGIDVGDIDLVLQVGCPRTISSAMQRLGRAGHNPGRVSTMQIFPRMDTEALYCGLTAQVARDGGIEKMRPPKLCLDVLAQHIVSMAAGESFSLDELMELLKRARPFYKVTKEQVMAVCAMLAGDYEHERDLPVRPRILYDRINERVEGDSYSRMLAISAGGTIPDRGLYPVRAENGARLGELDEEFVFEARVGDRFLLGAFAWQILDIKKDEVVVTQTTPAGAKPPFYKADWSGRGTQTGLAFGALLRNLSNISEPEKLLQALMELGMDKTAAESALSLLRRQRETTGVLPDDRTIIVERFNDDAGEFQMMVHSVFGRKVNAPLGLLMQQAAKHLAGIDTGCFDDNDGFLLFPYGERGLPEGLIKSIEPETARKLLSAMLPSTPLFNMAFRYNAARALMMGLRKTGRQPLWIQRLRGAEILDSVVRREEHPLVMETKRECLEDYWDLEGVEYVLRGIRSGAIEVREVTTLFPSPMSLPFRRQAEAALLYDYAPTTSGIVSAAAEALTEAQMIAPSPEQLEKVSERSRVPENESQLHALLMMEGDLIAGELDVPINWLDSLARDKRALYIEPGLWIAAEHEEEYSKALAENDASALSRIARRCLRYRGAQSAESLADRYLISEELARSTLDFLSGHGAVAPTAASDAAAKTTAVRAGDLYYHEALYDRARRETVKGRRSQIKTLPPERYAAYIAGKLRVNSPPAEQLETALRTLRGRAFPLAVWDNIILPVRVRGYRPEMLNTLLAGGEIYWKLDSDKNISFHLYEDIDWDFDMTAYSETLDGAEKTVFDTLLKRGAVFLTQLSGLTEGDLPYETLESLAVKGLVHSLNLAAVRQWFNKEKVRKSTARQRVNSRVIESSGRWELTRPEREFSNEEKLKRAFESSVLLCREVLKGVSDLSWAEALEILRIQEYTGKVRRGYFIEGLSGAQFIREKDFASAVLAFQQPQDDLVWLSAADPAQLWGKSLPHHSDRAFLNVAGTAVALKSGFPIAVFERQGQVLRVFEPKFLSEALEAFAREYSAKRIFSNMKRITVKQYAPETEEALASSGFRREMRDFTLYSGMY